MKFEHLGLSQSLLRATSNEGYETATPIQKQAIPSLLAGSDLMGCAQTGTGKTAAFALPTLHKLSEASSLPSKTNASSSKNQRNRNRKRAIRSLVLVPTRELAVQVAASFAKYGRFTQLRTTAVYGGVGQNPQVRALQNGVDILVATPGRLLDLMRQGHIDLNQIEILILDEADQMLDMGFLPDLRRIVAATPETRQTLMFSATMPEPIRRLASRWLKTPKHVQVTPVASPVATVRQSVYFVDAKRKPELLTHYLQNSATGRTLVFARTKHGADKIVKQLVRSGIRASALHGNKSQGARTRVLEQFKSENPPVLVATDIAARGLDVEAVSHVVSYELPEVPEVYVHRIGRTGRAGASGVATSFCSGYEHTRLRSIERLTRRSILVAVDHPQLAPLSPASAGSSDESKRKRRIRGRAATNKKKRQHKPRSLGQSMPSDSTSAQQNRTKRKRRRQPLGTAEGQGGHRL